MDKEKNFYNEGMLCHLLALTAMIGVPVGNILGPLVIWLMKKDESAFVDYHGKESLNFQISMIIYSFVCVISIIGILLIPLLALFQLIMPIIASASASKGEFYEYPLTIRFFK